LSVVLCGCETWPLQGREERRLEVFENRVLRKTFGLEREEITGRGENYVKKSFMFCSHKCNLNKSMGMGWAGHVGTCGGDKKCIQGFDE
jgi:hypothetical protein